MEEIVKYTLSKVSGGLSGSNQKWQGHVIPTGIVKPERFCEMIAQDSSLSVEDIEYVIKRMRRMALHLVGRGYVVNICDGIVLKPVIKGSFSAKDSSFDPKANAIVATAMTRGDARMCNLPDTKYVNAVSKPRPIINSVADSKHPDENVLYIGGTVHVQGKYLAPNPAADDEGVFLLDPTTEEIVAHGTIVKSNMQLIDATFEQWPTPGNYLFRIVTRVGKDADYSPCEVSKPVVVKDAAQ